MKIEKNVPIPSKYGVNKRNSKHKHLNEIIESWEVGDSVAFKSVRTTQGEGKRASYSIEARSLAERMLGKKQRSALWLMKA